MFGIRHSEISPKNSRVARWVATQRRMPHEHIRPTRSRSTDRARIVRIRIICCEVVTKRSWSSDTAYVSCSTQSPSLIFVRSSVRPSVRSFVRSFAYSSTSSIHSVGHLVHLIRWLMLAASAKEELLSPRTVLRWRYLLAALFLRTLLLSLMPRVVSVSFSLESLRRFSPFLDAEVAGGVNLSRSRMGPLNWKGGGTAVPFWHISKTPSRASSIAAWRVLSIR